MYRLIFTDPVINDFASAEEYILENYGDNLVLDNLFKLMYEMLIQIKEMPYSRKICRSGHRCSPRCGFHTPDKRCQRYCPFLLRPQNTG